MTAKSRIFSIDAFRAITMLLMIFVNDVSGVHNIPQWIEHVRMEDDGMGFADTVFPTFLFIVGLSIPFAIGYRMRQQQSWLKIESHILLRSVALIVMGFFHVNLESYSNTAPLPQAVWAIAITIAFFLIWLDYPETIPAPVRYGLMGAGVIVLIAMAMCYSGGTGDHLHGMEQSWGGILGIIGWAYLVCATLFLLLQGRFAGVSVILVCFLLINIGTHGGWLHIQLPVIGDAASVALIMAGVWASQLYTRLREQGRINSLWLLFAGIGIVAIAAGFLLRPYTEGISKIRSTPAWVLICTGIAVLVFELLIWITDVRGKNAWYKLIKPAGTSTLTCYLIPYLLYAVFELTGFRYPDFLSQGVGGILRSFAVALLVIILVGFMEKKHLRLKI
ncbi:DUF5009 domain-containing protein [Chitinophaga sp. Cy-1792]|uniref:DUF5009 domain-containing protein n=1 Tax=Chitinophaga sp. Cy-1792 TaxID=2608339 RepID=UPI00141EDE62|nr:DUF5009 domain-containing protein [Chitinophaga sp. Cy-1792]NIG54792.1 DUF5009 domain-containing protein [Chitinophaga sp. Cy-1792]